MALASTTVLEVRTTGDDTNNAGAFNPARAGAGTDYSLLSPLAFADLVLVTTTTVTSAAIGFTSDHVGNHLRVVSGTGFTASAIPYEILSVSGGTATLDRAAGTAGSTGGTGRLGGALASPGQAAGVKVAGNTVWIRGGIYTITAGTANTAGKVVSDTLLGYWLGYDAVRGDSTATRPVLRAGAAVTTLMTLSGQWSLAENLEFDNPSNFGVTTGLSLSGGSCIGRRCRSSGFGNGMVLGGSASEADNCLIQSCNRGIYVNLTGRVTRSVILNGTGSAGGIEVTAGNSGTTVVADCVLANGAGAGISCGAGSHILKNVAIYGHGGIGLILTDHVRAENVVVYGNTGGDVTLSGSVTLTPASRLAAVFAGSYGSGIPGVARVDGRTTLTANPFNDPVGLDFTPNNTAGGGALLREAGWPATLPGLLGTSYPDAGVYQHAPPSPATVAAAVWSYANRTLT
jgi:hypothetical protein